LNYENYTKNICLQATGASLEKFPRLQSWFNRFNSSNFPDYEEIIEKGANLFADWVSSNCIKGF
jgi:hypothetical protein